jgi:hypothetical protein
MPARCEEQHLFILLWSGKAGKEIKIKFKKCLLGGLKNC